MRSIRWFEFALSLSLCLAAERAHAAEPGAARDPAAAEALFEEGRQALDVGDYATACPKFAASQSLDPAPGTLLNLATCEEAIGQLALAWQHFEQALDSLPADDDRVAFARKRADQLAERLPRLTLRLPPEAPLGTVVLRDGVPLTAASIGSALPVDPGPHTIVVKSPGREQMRYTVELGEAEQRELFLMPGSVPAKASDEGHGPRPLSLAFLGVGAAGVATGIVTGVMLENDRDTVDAHCEGNVCDSTGLAAANRGESLIWVNTVAFGVGVASLAAGVVLLLNPTSDSSREKPNVEASIGPGGAAVGYGGHF